MKISEAIKWGIEKLKKVGVETPVLDAEVLLAHVLKKDRAWLYAHGEEELGSSDIKRFKYLISRRVKREPVAYITGHKEFYGLDFFVDRNVLVPRPETEMLVERVAREIRDTRPALPAGRLEITNMTVVDVGTGSGAIAVAVAKLYSLSEAQAKSKGLRQAQAIKWVATDISPAALSVARKNARRHKVEKKITFLRGDLLEPVLSTRSDRDNLTTETFIITANLPYLPTSEWRETMPEVRKWEPRGALDGGRDGLKYYRKLLRQLIPYVTRYTLRVTLFCEICPEQAVSFKKMARKYFPAAKFEIVKDLAEKNRVVVVKI